MFYVRWLVEARNGKSIFDYLRNIIIATTIFVMAGYIDYLSYGKELMNIINSYEYNVFLETTDKEYKDLLSEEMREEFHLYITNDPVMRTMDLTSLHEYEGMEHAVYLIESYKAYLDGENPEIKLASILVSIFSFFLLVTNYRHFNSVISNDFPESQKKKTRREKLVSAGDYVVFLLINLIVIMSIFYTLSTLKSAALSDESVTREDIFKYARYLANGVEPGLLEDINYPDRFKGVVNPPVEDMPGKTSKYSNMSVEELEIELNKAALEYIKTLDSDIDELPDVDISSYSGCWEGQLITWDINICFSSSGGSVTTKLVHPEGLKVCDLNMGRGGFNRGGVVFHSYNRNFSCDDGSRIETAQGRCTLKSNGELDCLFSSYFAANHFFGDDKLKRAINGELSLTRIR